MAKIIRPNENVEPFASQALSTERTVFNSESQSDSLDSNLNLSYLRGWGIVGVNELPTKQDFNASLYTSSSLNSYLFQMGIAEWNTNQEYFTNSITNFNGVLYKAQQNNKGVDPSLDDGTNWVEVVQDQVVPQATTTTRGTVEKATQTEMNSGTADKYPDATAVKTYVDASVITGVTKYSGSIVYNATPTINTFTNIDLSSTVGSNRALVFLSVEVTTNTDIEIRPDGETKRQGDNGNLVNTSGTSCAALGGGSIAYVNAITSPTGIIQLYADAWPFGAPTITITLLTYTPL